MIKERRLDNEKQLSGGQGGEKNIFSICKSLKGRENVRKISTAHCINLATHLDRVTSKLEIPLLANNFDAIPVDYLRFVRL